MNALHPVQRTWLCDTTNSTGFINRYITLARVIPPEPIRPREEVPNATTAKAIEDTLADKDVVRCESANEMFRNLGI
jgi:antitoxin component of RelBE/YafQ-DinJ toxin-antitoxin module